MLTSEQYGRVAQAVREDSRRWIEKVTIRSQSFRRSATAFGYARPHAVAKPSRRRSAAARVGAYGIAVSSSRA